MTTTALSAADRLWRQLVLPEEERRGQGSLWNGSYRWFRSSNVVDLWHYRSPREQQRIIEFMWRQQLPRKPFHFNT
jgi:hypothetical protein